MIPHLLAIFTLGAIGVFALAAVAGKRWIWAACAFEVLLVFYELSFALGPVREWIRLDLLLSMPLFCVGNLALSLYAFSRARFAALALAGSAVAVPVWFLLVR